ncbi:MAG: 3-dehydroquinate synthase [Verrucomicrobiales bacterium]|nr:3-dehydroquinate synthase [Verrucomicrobiales bacterium]
MLTIQSKSHPYAVEEFVDLKSALTPFSRPGVFCLADKQVYSLYEKDFTDTLPAERILQVEATEQQKSFESIAPLFVWLLKNGLKRDGVLLVVGGGVLQDIGCFIASVLFRGVRWELIPTTLLAQCDSCIGSKSSINIHSYKNQIGTFYPPHRVCMTYSVLKTLPWDEIRSGLGEAIKLHLLTSETAFVELMKDLSSVKENPQVLPKWVASSLEIKKVYIEQDEFDKGIRNILNYGHTFGHAYESATHYGIPHGIAVSLGMLTATYVSSRLGLVTLEHFQQLKTQLQPWYTPYEKELKKVNLEEIYSAIKMDKKNTKDSVNCILTKGFGAMEKTPVHMENQLKPMIRDFIQEHC